MKNKKIINSPTSIVEESVPCNFGENHKIILTFKGTQILNISCSCYKNRKEVIAAIKLGKLENQHVSCLQEMDELIKDVFTEKAGVIRKAPITASLTRHVRQSYLSIRRERKKLQIRTQSSSTTSISKRKESYIEEALGPKVAKVDFRGLKLFSIVLNEDLNKYQFKVLDRVIATLAKGKWHLKHAFEEDLVGKDSVFGRDCKICGCRGHTDHVDKPKHKATAYKNTFIALQVSSSEGIKKIEEARRNHELSVSVVEKRKDIIQLFSTRRNSKNIVGVVRPREEGWINF